MCVSGQPLSAVITNLLIHHLPGAPLLSETVRVPAGVLVSSAFSNPDTDVPYVHHIRNAALMFSNDKHIDVM